MFFNFVNSKLLLHSHSIIMLFVSIRYGKDHRFFSLQQRDPSSALGEASTSVLNVCVIAYISYSIASPQIHYSMRSKSLIPAINSIAVFKTYPSSEKISLNPFISSSLMLVLLRRCLQSAVICSDLIYSADSIVWKVLMLRSNQIRQISVVIAIDLSLLSDFLLEILLKTWSIMSFMLLVMVFGI